MENTKTIGKDYSLKELAFFALPAVFNELLISLLYTIDDGLFISRYVGPNALAAFSILTPIFMIHTATAALLGGVSNLASYKMGKKRNQEAKSDFTTMIILVLIIGIISAIIQHIFLKPILNLLGASEIIYPYAESFLKIAALYTPLTLISTIFSRGYIPAGKPKMQLISSVINMTVNIFFDWYFVVYKNLGMIGTAYANLIATSIMVLIGLFFFKNKNAELGFSKPHFKLLSLINSSARFGISSFFSNLSVAIATLISNYVILYYGDETYLAAYAIVNNIQFIFMSTYFGLLSTTGPIVSFAFGEKNKEKLNKTFKQIIILITALSILAIILFVLFGFLLAELFVAESAKDSKEIIYYGLKIAPFSFLFFGYNIAARSTLASLGEHKASGLLTILQEVIISNITIILLPMIFNIKAIWFSFLLTNILMLFITIYYVNKIEPKYL